MSLRFRPMRPGFLLVFLALAGCKTNVQSTSFVPPAAEAANALPRPTMVVVRNFAIDPYAIQVDPGIGGQLRRSANGTSMADAQINDSNDMQLAITDTLVAQVQAMGLPAQLDTGRLPPGNVLVIQGRVDSANEGNRTRRNVVGFGAGQSLVTATAQVFYVHDDGAPRLLQSYQADSNSGRMPGLAASGAASIASGSAVGIAVATGVKVATQPRTEVGSLAQRMTRRMSVNLGQFFAQQGWIPPASVPSRF